MDKIQKYSRILCVIFKIAVVFVLLGPVIVWWAYPEKIIDGFNLQYANFKILYQMTWQIRVLGLIVSLIPNGILAVIFVKLSQLFAEFSQARIFEEKNVTILRAVSYYLILREILNPLIQALSTFVLTFKNPPGHHLISISFSTINIGIIILAMVALVISWIMLEAIQLQNENKQFI